MKIITSLFMILNIAFPLLAIDTDPEDLSNFKDTYPKNCPECLGQFVGACTYPSSEMVLVTLVPNVYCSGLSCLFCPENPIAPACCSLHIAFLMLHGAAKCCLKCAKSSDRRELLDRANFARLCSEDDPLSLPSCIANVQNGCCLPARDLLYESASQAKGACIYLKSSFIEFLSPGMHALSDAIWSGCMGDCLNFLCGPGADRNKDS